MLLWLISHRILGHAQKSLKLLETAFLFALRLTQVSYNGMGAGTHYLGIVCSSKEFPFKFFTTHFSTIY